MAHQVAGRRRRPSPLMIAVWALATLIIATVASAALGDLGVEPLEFRRALPVVLLGEALLYVMVLGGGLVPGPILLVAFALGFVLRAGIAVLATELAPRGPIENLFISAQYYYASCWPAVTAQVVLVALLLRLSRRALARPRRPRRAVRPVPAETADDAAARHEHLLAALTEDPDAPPSTQTAFEERQIGDLLDEAEPVEQELAAAGALDRELPFDSEPESEPAVIEMEPAGEEAEEQPTPETVPEAPEQAAPSVAPEQAPEPEAAEPDAGEPTETLEPVVAVAEGAAPREQAVEVAGLEAVPAPDHAPPADVQPEEPAEGALQEMVDTVVSRLGGAAEVQIRVRRTADGRTIIAVLPAGVTGAEIGPEADAVGQAHLRACAHVGIRPTDLQLGAGDRGGYAVRALDDGGTLMLLLSSHGEQATGRLEMMAQAVFEALRALTADLRGSVSPSEPLPTGALEEEPDLSRRLGDVSARLTPCPAGVWRAHRRRDRKLVAVAAPPGAGTASLAESVAACCDAAAALALALGLGELCWLGISGPSASLVARQCRADDEAVVLGALSSPPAGLGQALWDLGRVATLICEPAG